MKIFNRLKKNIIIKKFLVSSVLIILALAPGLALATDEWGPPERPAGIPASAGDLAGVMTNIINWVLGFIALVAVLMLIWGGVRYVTAIGDESKVEDAKHIISEAVIGLTIVGMAYAIVVVVVNAWVSGIFS